MQNSRQFLGENIKYDLKISNRARYMRLAVYPEGKLVITVPRLFDQKILNNFLIAKSDWIKKKLDYFSKRTSISPRVSKAASRKEYLKYKLPARILIEQRLNYFNQFYNLKWGRISIRNTKTRWGSCSKRGNLNFSYKLAIMPAELCDYVIVHELCHLKEFNHSPNFWNLVSQTVPDFKQRRKQLKFLI